MVCLPPSVIAVNGLDGGGAGENDDEPVLLSLSAAPSPQSEAVANELQELSLQPELTLGLHPGRNPNLPPLSERKNVLQLKLQQRRTREELVSQGIMPPLKSPAAFHEQRRSLERARVRLPPHPHPPPPTCRVHRQHQPTAFPSSLAQLWGQPSPCSSTLGFYYKTLAFPVSPLPPPATLPGRI